MQDAQKITAHTQFLIIRADADEGMGAGHIMRCLALAQEWQAKFGDVLFISSCPSAIEKRIQASGFKLERLGELPSLTMGLDITLDRIKDIRPDWVVLDGYHFNRFYHDQIRAAGTKLLIVDDYAHLPAYRADMILNQNLGAQAIAYPDRTTPLKLLGSQFTMLRDDFLASLRPAPNLPDRALNVLITTGGADPDNLTLKIIEALNRENTLPFHAKIIIGPANPNQSVIENTLAGSKREYEIISNTSEMPRLMAWADMAVSAGGSTAWELSYFGVPSIYIIMADNQENIVKSLESAGAGINAGRHSEIDTGQLAKMIQELALDSARRNCMATSARSLISPKGRNRVALAMASFCPDTRLEITILSDKDSWIIPYAETLCREIRNRFNHQVRQIHSISQMEKGDITFIMGCGQMIPQAQLDLNTHNLVVHESSLPKGKGWSPMTWQILEGKNTIPITLFEAVEKMDAGPIYLQKTMKFKGHELVDELRHIQGKFSIDLCLEFLADYATCLAGAREQKGKESTYPRRTPLDSRLDTSRSINDQFNLMRVADNDRYPLFFDIRGHTYELKIKKSKKPHENDTDK